MQQTESPAIQQISARQAALLQLAPAFASLPFYAVLAWFLAGQGIPNLFALLFTILLIEVPVSWIIMVRHVRREHDGRFTLAAAFPWRTAVPWWQYLVIGVPVTIFSTVMVAGVSPQFQTLLLESFFDGLPGWFVMNPGPGMFSTLSRELLLTLWVLMLFGMVLVGGMTQELFARGFLLPRTQNLGRWAPAFNALFFAIFHLISPWNWLPFFLMVLPWAYLVWWRRSVKIGLFIHVGMLALQWLAMTLIIFGLAPAPV